MFLPHTLKVNELPKHSHNMPGYDYGNLGNSDFFLETGNGAFLAAYFDESEWHRKYMFEGFVNSAGKKYRSFRLGFSNNGTTTSTGNNESHKTR